MDLAQLLDPLDVATFKRDYWESKPLVSCTNEASRFKEILSMSAVDDILCHSSLRSDDIRIAKNGEATPLRELLDVDTNAGEGGLEALYQEYRKGSSIVLLFLHERWSPLKTLCQSLSSELSSRVQANVYLTPPGAQALDTHYDTHDVLVLQIHGKKQWRLFEPTLQLPLSHQRYSVEEKMGLSAPIREVTLSPGDLMYLPRGYPHDAVSVDVASLHLTVGMIPVTWASVILGAVRTVIDNNSMFRRSLPPGFASDPNLQAEIAARMPELMIDVLKGIDVNHAIDEARVTALLGRQPSLAGHLIDLELLPRLASDTLVQRRKDVEVSVITSDESISVAFHGKKIDFPPYVGSEIQFIVDTEDFRPCELPGDLDRESRLVLVSRLLTEGLLMIHRSG
jgi:ribosomal protein L16 Arg81 hydroxylase